MPILQKIVLFIEPDGSQTIIRKQLSKLGNLFMNRFTIDDDANHEFLGIVNLEPCSMDFYEGKITPAEGLDLIIQNLGSFDKYYGCKIH